MKLLYRQLAASCCTAALSADGGGGPSVRQAVDHVHHERQLTAAVGQMRQEVRGCPVGTRLTQPSVCTTTCGADGYGLMGLRVRICGIRGMRFRNKGYEFTERGTFFAEQGVREHGIRST